MGQFLEFLAHHWLLTLAFVAILGALLGTYVYGGLRAGSKVSPLDATRLINRDEAVVIDVRDEGEFKQGHILNAIHVPVKALPERVGKLENYRDRPIITVCRNGQRSASASAVLRKQGFARVYTLSGGLLAWENANLPLVKK